jgi:hypothetical protein
MNNPDPCDEKFWIEYDEKNRQQERERRKKKWAEFKKVCLYTLAAAFCIWFYHSCNRPSAPIFGYLPAELYRYSDEKSFQGLVEVRAYEHYEEDIAAIAQGPEWTVERFRGYQFDVHAIVLRNAKKHPLIFSAEEKKYNKEFEAETDESLWSIKLVRATQDNVKQYKPKIGNWPVIFLE